MKKSEKLTKADQKKHNPNAPFRNIFSIFRSLRWRMTLSYTIVTISALLVVELIVMIILMSYFVLSIDLTPETLVANLREEWTPMMQHFFSSEPPDVDGARKYLEDVQGTVIRTRPLLVFGSLQLEMRVKDFLHFYYLLNDRTLVYAIPSGIVSEEDLGKKIPYDYLPGLDRPLRAALQGEEDQNLLYEIVEPGHRIIGAIPVFRFEPTDVGYVTVPVESLLDIERNLVGIVVFTTKHFPWQFLPLGQLILYIGRSLLIITLFAGLIGSVFGLWTAKGLTRRLTHVSQAAHDWARGDFSVSIRDTSKDEIGKLTSDLNLMAKQLENLMDRRQELTILEERNRLARDLHDSVKQQAFAASAQLAAARVHMNAHPEKAYEQLKEAELLIEKVRQELTDLILELRPGEIKGKGLVVAAENFISDWRRRNEISIEFDVWGEEHILPLDAQKSIFRILQEALANVLWHSQAKLVRVSFDFRSYILVVIIEDDGKGFVVEQRRGEGMGLDFMKERAALIGGELIISSFPGRGTSIVLRYPYPVAEI